METGGEADARYSISSLLTLAGMDDPSKAPSFQSVVLDQIVHLRKQLDEDEQAFLDAKLMGWIGGSGDEGEYGGAGEGGEGGGEGDEERQRRLPALRVVQDAFGQEGLPQFVRPPGDYEDDIAAPMMVLQSAQ